MAPRFFKPTGRTRAHRKGFSPREILASDMSNTFIEDPKYREHAWGGESHAYYDGHDARTVPNKVWMQQNSPVVQTDENGNRFVEMFHWTNPANVPSILKSGLAESLGPDAGRWQARKGVWTSYGDRNPMSYDYVNNKRITENGFNQVPLKIRIPEDEYNGMRVDHTGQTFDDNVAVFRAPRDVRYGTISFKEAGTGKERKEKVAIPPQYISEYQLPESWSMKGLNERGTKIPAYTYPGWRPGMKNAQLPNFNLFGLNRALGGDRIEHNGVINAFNEDEYRALDLASRQLNDNIRKSPKKAKQVYLGLYKNDLSLHEALKGKLPSDFGVEYGFKGNKSGKGGEPSFARRLPMMAHEEKYLSPYTRIKSPYELAAKWNFSETQPNGAFRRGYERQVFGESPEKVDAMDVIDDKTTPLIEDYPRTSKYVSDLMGDRRKISNLMTGPNSTSQSNSLGKATHDQHVDNQALKDLRSGYAADDVLHDWYTYNAGIDANMIKRAGNQKAVLGVVRPEEFEDKMRKGTKSYRKMLLNHYDWRFHGEYPEDRNYNSLQKFRNDPDFMTESYAKTFKPNKPLSDEEREDLVKRWKEQRSLDSLDRVIGHHYGRKIGKYRASRGKYGLDK